MKKLVIDCSKPIGHPEQQSLVDMTQDEIDNIARRTEEIEYQLAKEPQKTLSLEDRLAAIENELQQLKESK